jgi:hypothetical protein
MQGDCDFGYYNYCVNDLYTNMKVELFFTKQIIFQLVFQKQKDLYTL